MHGARGERSEMAGESARPGKIADQIGEAGKVLTVTRVAFR